MARTACTCGTKRKKKTSLELISVLSGFRWSWEAAEHRAVYETNDEERRNRGDGEVLEPGQRQRPAGVETLRRGGAGVRLPCLHLRVDSE